MSQDSQSRIRMHIFTVTGTFVPTYFCSRERKFHRCNFCSLVLSLLLFFWLFPYYSAAFMVDFEATVWEAIRAEFTDTTIKGCTFHFSQAI